MNDYVTPNPPIPASKSENSSAPPSRERLKVGEAPLLVCVAVVGALLASLGGYVQGVLSEGREQRRIGSQFRSETLVNLARSYATSGLNSLAAIEEMRGRLSQLESTADSWKSMSWEDASKLFEMMKPGLESMRAKLDFARAAEAEVQTQELVAATCFGPRVREVLRELDEERDPVVKELSKLFTTEAIVRLAVTANQDPRAALAQYRSHIAAAETMQKSNQARARAMVGVMSAEISGP